MADNGPINPYTGKPLWAESTNYNPATGGSPAGMPDPAALAARDEQLRLASNGVGWGGMPVVNSNPFAGFGMADLSSGKYAGLDDAALVGIRQALANSPEGLKLNAALIQKFGSQDQLNQMINKYDSVNRFKNFTDWQKLGTMSAQGQDISNWKPGMPAQNTPVTAPPQTQPTPTTPPPSVTQPTPAPGVTTPPAHVTNPTNPASVTPPPGHTNPAGTATTNTGGLSTNNTNFTGGTPNFQEKQATNVYRYRTNPAYFQR